jgi:hypothetical protein
MRAVVSYAAGVLTLLMILASGGAWALTSEPGLVPIQLNEIHAEFPYLDRACTARGRRACSWTSARVSFGFRRSRLCHDHRCRRSRRPVRRLRPCARRCVGDVRLATVGISVLRAATRRSGVAHHPSVSRVDGHPSRTQRRAASGLFQHLASMWPERSAAAGWSGADVFDPVANTAVAAWLVYDFGGWSHWYPSANCWR